MEWVWVAPCSVHSRMGPASTGCPAMACFGGEPRSWTLKRTLLHTLPAQSGHPGGRGLLIPGRGQECWA